MNSFWYKVRKLFLLKLRFALTSSVATIIDYGIYLALVYTLFEPAISNLISASCGLLVNFFLQKKYVFSLNRKLSHAFFMAVGVSLGGIGLGTLIIWGLTSIPVYIISEDITKIAVKLIATGLVFFYNFYMKRFVFEKRFFKVD
jgi:putative flippase GtrA